LDDSKQLSIGSSPISAAQKRGAENLACVHSEVMPLSICDEINSRSSD
jgi:hypothetical protein